MCCWLGHRWVSRKRVAGSNFLSIKQITQQLSPYKFETIMFFDWWYFRFNDFVCVKLLWTICYRFSFLLWLYSFPLSIFSIYMYTFSPYKSSQNSILGKHRFEAWVIVCYMCTLVHSIRLSSIWGVTLTVEEWNFHIGRWKKKFVFVPTVVQFFVFLISINKKKTNVQFSLD